MTGLPSTPEEVTPRSPSRTPTARVLETVTERIEPQERICAHCGKTKCQIGCEKSERFEYIQPKETEWLVIQMRKLYLIERHARNEGMTPEQRHGFR